MKRLLIGLVATIVVLGVVGYLFRNAIGFWVARTVLTPDHPYSGAPPPPDYTQDRYWAALPNREDYADVVPDAAMKVAGADAPVDVFFLHPTTYYNSEHWNQPLDDVTANLITDRYVLTGQASVFNGCCRVFAPRYRQATLAVYFNANDSARQALELAYADTVAAFEHFIAHFNDGRPFVLAAHSQGSGHLARLLAEHVSGTPLRTRLVAAYPIGYSIPRGEHTAAAPDIPVCGSPSSTGCLVTWNSVGPDLTTFYPPDAICVNPLSWREDEFHADHALNLGAVSFGGLNFDVDEPPPLDPLIEPGAADARCTQGQLLVSKINSDRFNARLTGPNNLHVYDYSLFHMNIRENVAERIAAFLGS